MGEEMAFKELRPIFISVYPVSYIICYRVGVSVSIFGGISLYMYLEKGKGPLSLNEFLGWSSGGPSLSALSSK